MGLPPQLASQPVLIDATRSIRQAAQQMAESGIGSLLVRRPEGGLGLVTDRDLAFAVLCDGHDPGTSVDICTGSRVTTVTEDHSPFDIARTLARRGVSRVPVLDRDGVLTGVVSSDDLAWYFAQELRRLAQAIRTGFEHESHPPAPAGPNLGRE